MTKSPKKRSKKSTSKKPALRPLSSESLGLAMGVPTIESRILAAQGAVVLVNETLEGFRCRDDVDGDLMLDSIVMHSIRDVLSRAADDLWWLSQLPKSVLQQSAPTDDQKSAIARNGGSR